MSPEINTEEMVFRTKFEPGDGIYFMHDDKVYKGMVDSIETVMKKSDGMVCNTIYRVNDSRKKYGESIIEVPETKAFDTIENLFKSNDFDSNNQESFSEKPPHTYHIDYKIGDSVYFIRDNSVTDGTVKNIKMSINKYNINDPYIVLELVSVSRKEEYSMSAKECFCSIDKLQEHLKVTYVNLITCGLDGRV